MDTVTVSEEDYRTALLEAVGDAIRKYPPNVSDLDALVRQFEIMCTESRLAIPVLHGWLRTHLGQGSDAYRALPRLFTISSETP